MNLPVPPPIDLSGLASVDSLEASQSKPIAASVLPLGLASAVVVAGVSAWRIASVVAARRETRARRKTALLAAGAGLLVVGLARWQLQRLTNDEPEHEVEERLGDLEIRRYAPMQIARTTVGGSWDEALDEGFRRLARFIFGANVGEKKIAMTSPVTSTQEGEGYRVAFVMPKGHAAPTPKDARVSLMTVPERRLAVLRFSGRYTGEQVEAKKRQLLAAVKEKGLETRGEPSFAGYDPPSTLPLLRRNEVWIELSTQGRLP